MRNRDQFSIRPFSYEPAFIHQDKARVLVTLGNTKVICSATLSEGTPKFIGPNQGGWLTAEYGMLPTATHTRNQREAQKGKQSGRTIEIQRLIGRSLRQCVNLNKLNGKSITIDCDVIQADGSTRVTSITGGSIALKALLTQHNLQHTFTSYAVGISVGVAKGEILVDLDYNEDSTIDTDMNLVFNQQGHLIEVQATAEQEPLDPALVNKMILKGQTAAMQIFNQLKN